MSDAKATRLAAIRAANAQKQGDAAPAPVTIDVPIGPPLDKATRLAAIRAANAQRPSDATAASAALEGSSAAAAATLPMPAPVTGATIPLAPAATTAAPAEQSPALSAPSLGLLLLAAVGGAFLATFALPAWLPGLSASLLGPEPKAYWYLARSTAFIAYGLLWLSMALGLMMTNKLARLWPGGPLAFDLHQHASILGLAFGLFHALILLGDGYSNYTLGQILIPFTSGGTSHSGWARARLVSI
jgi:hypothetical protein